MEKLFSTKVHGILDYVTAGTLVALPRIFGWSDKVRMFMDGSALGLTAYSALTRYEVGLVKTLPMKGHLILDALSGLSFCAAPLLFPDEDDLVVGTLVAFGLWEIAASLSTETQPSLTEQGSQIADTIEDKIDDLGDILQDRTLGL